ncbi:MAG TPA: hypothetical protein VGI57_04120 [Usitatibacter sp.]
MNNYKFAAYPSNSSVAAGVTVLVSVWFLVAAGAILSDPSSPYTRKVVSEPVKTAQAQAPKVFETMYVSARTPQLYDTIQVSAKRPVARTAT